MKGKDIRQGFLDYFAGRGHRPVRSSSLVPENDPTLLFANAGMNQFKNVFLGNEKREYSRAVTCQKCVRAGGKHNDLENVGRTARHHTFFEMLGNFSFGDYFKAEAIEFAWELITKIYGIDPARLYATVFETDDEASGLWRKIAGLPPDRILRLGEKDNFWAMGDTGPCGPCSEILVDLGRSPEGHGNCPPDCSCGRYLEIWNLVFMQYQRGEDQVLHPLPKPSIDTGMGLERVASVLQGRFSNYDSDLFTPVLREIEEITGQDYEAGSPAGTSMRIIADHCRAGAFLVSDGVIPSNEGRGYVLRKILRRAIRHGKLLGLPEPFLYRLTGFVAGQMGDVYDELVTQSGYVARVIRTEEEKFTTTLEFGLRKLEELVPAGDGPVLLPGADIFRLYDTFGFPLDLLQDIADEKKWQLDLTGFQAELEKQQERARASWKGDGQKAAGGVISGLSRTQSVVFEGYETLVAGEAQVAAMLKDDQLTGRLAAGEEGELMLDRTPFYAESGGQVGDQGYIHGEHFTAQVLDTRSPATGVVLHRVKILQGEAKTGQTVRAEVDEGRRLAIAANHTATHLLHASLRDVLGTHVKQAGSLVAPDRMRFDFSHFAALTGRELEIIEEMVNEQIWRNRPVHTAVLPVEEAVKSGAMALFGEKYQEQVRVVSVEGYSRELCGGTHLASTGQMGSFKIVAESSIASGVRRIEAVTGREAYRRFARDEQLLASLSQTAHVELEQLAGWADELQENLRQKQKEVDRLKVKMASLDLEKIAASAQDVDGVRVAGGLLADVDRAGLRNLAAQLMDRLQSGVVALGAEIDGKASLVVMVSPDRAGRLPAGKIVGALAAKVEGGGGGKPQLAEAGGRNPALLPEAMAQLAAIVRGLQS